MARNAQQVKNDIEQWRLDQLQKLFEDLGGLSDKELQELGLFRQGEQGASRSIFGERARRGEPSRGLRFAESPAFRNYVAGLPAPPEIPQAQKEIIQGIFNNDLSRNAYSNAYREIQAGRLPNNEDVKKYIDYFEGRRKAKVAFSDPNLERYQERYLGRFPGGNLPQTSDANFKKVVDALAENLPPDQFLPEMESMFNSGIFTNTPANRTYVQYLNDMQNARREFARPNPEEKYEKEGKEIKEQNEVRRQGVNYGVPFERLAPLPESTKRAINVMREQEGKYAPYLQEAHKLTSRAKNFPESRQDYMNPYIKDVVDEIRREGLKTYEQNILPSLERSFVQAGQHGSSKHQELKERTALDIQKEILGRQAKALASGYGQAANIFNEDQLRRLKRAEQLQNLSTRQQAATLADVAGLSDVGRMEQAHAQHGLGMQYEDYMRRKNLPFERTMQQIGALSGAPQYNLGSMSYSAANSPQNQQLNSATSLGSTGLQLLGALTRRRGGAVKRRRRR